MQLSWMFMSTDKQMKTRKESQTEDSEQGKKIKNK